MLIPVIKVRDKANGTVHIIGTNSHDSLIVDKHNIRYYNLQNGCGTLGNDEYGYEFEYEENGWDVPYIEFVTLEKWIELSKTEMDKDVTNLLAFYDAFVERQQKRVIEGREKAGIVWDSGGEILE